MSYLKLIRLICYCVVSVVLFSILFYSVGVVDAVSVSPLTQSIGIAWSKSCMIMLQNNFTTNCPTIKAVYDLGLDNSNKVITGNFSYIDGLFQREHPKLINHWRFYDYDNTFYIFVDPPGDMRKYLKMIYLENTLPEYFAAGDLVKVNDTRIIHHTRYVNPNCSGSSITSENWEKILPDTILFMRHVCDPQFTLIKTSSIFIDEHTHQDITTSANYQLQQYQKWIKANCLKTYGLCKEKPSA